LQVTAPVGALSAEDRAELQRLKPQILEYLARISCPAPPANAPTVVVDRTVAALADWIMLLEPGDLPSEEFQLTVYSRVVNRDKFIRSLQQKMISNPNRNAEFAIQLRDFLIGPSGIHRD
jgi:hypothetical protein